MLSRTFELVESRVRCLVADCLGVGVDQLAPEVSLTDELAVDSLDLVELAITLESEFGIIVPERILEWVRTYGDLVDATVLLVRERREAEARSAETPAIVYARVVPPEGVSGGELLRADWLTPYAAQTIAEDACWAGRGARLEVTVAANTDEADLARVEDQFARLGNRGIQVTVRRTAPPEMERAHAEQLCLPLGAGPPIGVTPGPEIVIGGGGTYERPGANQGLHHGPQPARQGQDRGQQRRAVPGDGEGGAGAR